VEFLLPLAVDAIRSLCELCSSDPLGKLGVCEVREEG
jgi:hypothetical protein